MYKGYRFYLDRVLLPVPPSKLELKIKNQNSTYNLINEGEINILKSPGLTEIDFEVELPNFERPYARYKNDKFKRADYYLNKLELLKVNKKPFKFIVTRMYPNNKTKMYSTNMKVSLEDYTIKEDKKEGFDVIVSIKLKQYKSYGTKKCKVTIKQKRPVATASSSRSAKSTSSSQTYTVKRGDSLWSIAKKFYGNGSYWGQIYNANKDKISNPNSIYPGQVLTIPAAGTYSNSVSYSGKSSGGSSKKNYGSNSSSNKKSTAGEGTEYCTAVGSSDIGYVYTWFIIPNMGPLYRKGNEYYIKAGNAYVNYSYNVASISGSILTLVDGRVLFAENAAGGGGGSSW